MIRLDDEDKAAAYGPWTETAQAIGATVSSIDRLARAESKIRALEADVDSLLREVVYLRGWRDAMRGV